MAAKPSVERSRGGRPTSAGAAELTARLRRAAMDTFLELGYDGTTMEAVAQAAGVSKNTLYARYPDKRALFVAVSSWALTRQERNARVLEPLPDDLGEALILIAQAILARSVDPDIVRMSRMAIAEAARFPEFAASSQAVTWSPRIQVIMDLLRRHERTGAVVVRDVEMAAEQFFAMVGAMPAWLAAYGIHRTPEVEEAHLRHAVDLFLHGIRVRTGADAAHSRTPLVAVRGPAATTRAAASAPSPRPVLAARRRLGRSGLDVAPLGLGLAVSDDRGAGVAAPVAADLLRRYLDAGGNLLDLADARAEEVCSRMLPGRRDEVVLAVHTASAPGRRHTRRQLRAACEASLRRLGTDRIDLYQLSGDDPSTPLEEVVDVLDDLVRAGKVLYTGVVDFPAYRLMKALAVADVRARARFVSYQSVRAPARDTLERELLPLFREEGLGFLSGESGGEGDDSPGTPSAGPATAVVLRPVSEDRLATALAAQRPAGADGR